MDTVTDRLRNLFTTLSNARRGDRPFTTLTYAQSLDGSLAVERGQPLAISGPEAQSLTHKLRAAHQGILIGIGTLLADDPRLTARGVEGPQPQPIVVDTQLRSAGCAPHAALFQHPRPPWILSGPKPDPHRLATLQSAGATILATPIGPDDRLDLATGLRLLAERGLASVMIEGGAEIIQSVLHARLPDLLLLTIAPRLVGGLNAVGALNANARANLKDPAWVRCGLDMLVWGQPQWPAS